MSNPIKNAGKTVLAQKKPLDVQESVSADSEAPGIRFICSMVDYGIYTYSEVVWYIFISKISFCVLMVQIADLSCKVQINTDIFVSLSGMFSKVMFLQ